METVYAEQGTAPIGRKRRNAGQEVNAFHSRTLLGVETRNSNKERPAQIHVHPRPKPSKSWSGTIPIFALLVVAIVIGVVAWVNKRSDKGVDSEV